MVQDCIKGQPNLFFVVRGSYCNNVQIWERSHVLAACTNATYEINLSASRSFLLIMKVIEATIALFFIHNQFNIIS